MEPIGKIIKERNITFDSAFDPVSRGGFTQVPTFIMKCPDLSPGAKITYSLFLSYAWHNDGCFPGQNRLAADLNMSRSRVTEFVSELEKANFLTIKRRGQGLTNLYEIHFQVKSKFVQRKRGILPPDVGGPTSRSRPSDN